MSPQARGRRLARAFRLGLALGLAAGFLSSCGGEAPEVLGLEWRLELRPRQGGSYESLSVFAKVHDFDGPADLESLSLREASTGLSWKLTEANWTMRKSGEDTWVGGANLSMPDRGPLPRGDYLLEVRDLAGQVAQTPFTLAGKHPTLPLPTLSLTGKRGRAESSWPENVLLGYDAAGNLVAARPVTGKNLDLEAVLGAPNLAKAASLALYGYNPETHVGAYSWKTRN